MATKTAKKIETEEPVDYSKVSLVKAKNEALEALNLIAPKLTKGVIKNEGERDAVDQLRLELKQRQKAWTVKVKPIIDGINVARNGILELRREVDSEYTKSIEAADKMLGAYASEQRRIAQAEEDARQEEARKIEARAQAKLNMAKMTTAPKAKDRLMTEAAEMQVKAEALIDRPIEVETAANSISIPVLKCQAYSIRELIRHIAQLEATGGRDLTSLLSINQPELNALLALDEPKPGMGTWLPGVEVKEEMITRTRRGLL